MGQCHISVAGCFSDPLEDEVCGSRFFDVSEVLESSTKKLISWKEDIGLESESTLWEAFLGIPSGEKHLRQAEKFAEDYVLRNGGEKVSPLKTSQVMALHLFTQDTVFAPVNTALRQQNEDALQLWWPYLRQIFSAAERLPRMNPEHVGYRLVCRDFRSVYKTDVIFEEMAIVSTTGDESKVDEWHRLLAVGSEMPQTKFIVRGTSGVNIEQFSQHPSEAEVIYLPPTKFKVVNVQTISDFLFEIELTEVDIKKDPSMDLSWEQRKMEENKYRRDVGSTSNNRDTARALCGLASLLRQDGRFQNDVEKLYLRALDLEPDNVSAMHNLAVLVEKEDEEYAEQLYDKVLVVDEWNGPALTNLGWLLSSRDSKRAESLYRRALAIHDLDSDVKVDALCNLGALLVQQNGDKEEAEELYSSALDINPRHVDTLFQKAFLLQDRKNYSEAEEFYRRVLLLNPNHVDSLNNLGWVVHNINGNLPAATKLYERALHVDPKHVFALFNLGKLLETEEAKKKGSIELAEHYYWRALDEDPNHIDALLALAGLLRKSGDRNRAEDKYREVLRIKPNHVVALRRLGKLLQDQSWQLDQAINYYKRSLELDPSACDANTEVLCDLGILFHEYMKESEIARGYYQRALQADPNHPRTLYNLNLLLGRTPSTQR